jgi:hypothetical protein
MGLLRKLKHWQIFLLVVGLPLVLQLIQSIIFLSSADGNEANYGNSLGLLLILPLLIYYGWIGSVGTVFSQKNSPVPMPTGRFRLSLWTSAICSILLLVYFWAYPQYLQGTDNEEAVPIILVGVLVFVALFTLFYCLSFMARAIVQRERVRRVTSSEFYSEFVMAVFFPIGIWLLQPRVNKLEGVI